MRAGKRSTVAAAWLLMGSTTALSAATPDPHLDLEQVDGAQALATVKGWNGWTTDRLSQAARLRGLSQRAPRRCCRTIARSPSPSSILGDRVLNFWQDATHPRGLWRISPLAAFAGGKPQWRTLIDVGALGKAEGRRWVFKGATCLSPAYVRCIVSLSDGGGDAAVEREYDLDAGAFLAGGFALPAAKSEVAWAGPDALYVGTDFGPGSMTDSGYARIVKLWKRGTPLASATDGQRRRGERRLGRAARSGRWRPDLADRAARDRFLPPQAQSYRARRPADRLAAARRRRCLRRDRRPADRDAQERLERASRGGAGRLFDPRSAGRQGRPRSRPCSCRHAHQAVEEVSASKSLLWVKLLDDVSGRLLALRRDAGGRWSGGAVALPGNVHRPPFRDRARLAISPSRPWRAC